MARTGDSIVIDPVTRKVTHVNGEAVREHTAEMDAIVEEALGPAEPAKRQPRQKSSNDDI
jgi:hypothetical protein